MAFAFDFVSWVTSGWLRRPKATVVIDQIRGELEDIQITARMEDVTLMRGVVTDVDEVVGRVEDQVVSGGVDLLEITGRID